ncbi:receptor-like protein kinase [Carex littledalei]|uniref:Receptor-like protein kinase n=1 Tax=Carex littledalei TaxID=544730 RepID=A0A833R6Y2_9POAL|nr:receptor-like protein kinase [Carex littledalei]
MDGRFISLSVTMFCILFSLLCNGGLTHSRTQNHPSNCASSCGHLNDIHHPFRLKTDPAHCGSSYFEIICDAEKPYLEWRSGKYYIMDISYFYQRINVVDPAYMDQNSCKLPIYPLENIYQLEGPIGICGIEQSSASFLSCTKQIQNPNYISCMSGNDSFVYVLMGESFTVSNMEPSCKYVNMTFISDVDFKSGTTKQSLDALHEGFQICWYFRDQIKHNQENREQLLVPYPYWYWGLVDTLRRYSRHMKLPLISPLVNSEMFFLECMGENDKVLRNLGYINKQMAEAVVDSIIVIFILLQILQLIIGKEIALGVARGIDYLHRECDMKIIHFDIKPHNVLLDDKFIPKISDFGLAKLYPKDFSLVSVSIAKGTAGYIAPELLSRNFGAISDKSDVYSFGMLLLDMTGGKRIWDPEMNSTSQKYYPTWIYDQLVQNRQYEVSIEIDEMEAQLATIGLWCIQIKPSDRPSMSKVVEMLAEDNLDSLTMPPRPFFSCTRSDSSEYIAGGSNNF